MQKSERHVNHWDVRASRRFAPYYFLGNLDRYDHEPYPPVTVEISAKFDNNEAALAFERAVRELLEKA